MMSRVVNTENESGELDLLISIWRGNNLQAMKEELDRTHGQVIECRMRNKKHSLRILQMMAEFKEQIAKSNVNFNTYYPFMHILRTQVEAYFHNEDEKINNVYFMNINNILNAVLNSTHVIDRLIDLTKANAYMLSSYGQIINNFKSNERNVINTLVHKLNESNETKAQMYRQVIALNKEVEFYKSTRHIMYNHQEPEYSPVTPTSTSYEDSTTQDSLSMSSSSSSASHYLTSLTNENEVDTKAIANRIIAFLKQYHVSEKDFYHKVLRTSLLSYKNIIECPQQWSILNTSFKLYYKRASIFFNNLVEQKAFIAQVHAATEATPIEVEVIDEKHIFLLYDISKVQIRNGSEAIAIIDNVVRKLGENGLNKKILCDAILGIPLNTMSLFCNKAEKWTEMSDYAKESVMRMYAWLCDPCGVAKLLDWKTKYYSTSTIKSKCASRVRRCFSGLQLKVLLKEFHQEQTPSKEKISELSKFTNLSEKTIMKWFRNRRYKCLKLSRQTLVASTDSNDSSKQ